MLCRLLFLAFVFGFCGSRLACAQDDGPPIVITSPDTGTTYALALLKAHTLFWNSSQKMLVARVTFIEEDDSPAQNGDDTHEFRLPGVNYDPASGVFTATTAKGEVIPVAHFKKNLFVKSIEVLPNAHVRILHPRGVISVVLEAISPNDPAMHPSHDNPDPDGTHSLDIDKILH